MKLGKLGRLSRKIKKRFVRTRDRRSGDQLIRYKHEKRKQTFNTSGRPNVVYTNYDGYDVFWILMPEFDYEIKPMKIKRTYLNLGAK